MMILDCVELPYPPSVNHYWEPCVYKNEGKLYEAAGSQRRRFSSSRLWSYWQGEKCRNRARRSVADGIFPDRKVRDLDNLLKGVLDGLVAAGVMLDDSQIHDLHVVNSGEIVTGGKIVVSVWEILE